jgi:hypothetical protein
MNTTRHGAAELTTWRCTTCNAEVTPADSGQPIQLTTRDQGGRAIDGCALLRGEHPEPALAELTFREMTDGQEDNPPQCGGRFARLVERLGCAVPGEGCNLAERHVGWIRTPGAWRAHVRWHMQVRAGLLGTPREDQLVAANRALMTATKELELSLAEATRASNDIAPALDEEARGKVIADLIAWSVGPFAREWFTGKGEPGLSDEFSPAPSHAEFLELVRECAQGWEKTAIGKGVRTAIALAHIGQYENPPGAKDPIDGEAAELWSEDLILDTLADLLTAEFLVLKDLDGVRVWREQ